MQISILSDIYTNHPQDTGWFGPNHSFPQAIKWPFLPHSPQHCTDENRHMHLTSQLSYWGSLCRPHPLDTIVEGWSPLYFIAHLICNSLFSADLKAWVVCVLWVTNILSKYQICFGSCRVKNGKQYTVWCPKVHMGLPLCGVNTRCIQIDLGEGGQPWRMTTLGVDMDKDVLEQN